VLFATNACKKHAENEISTEENYSENAPLGSKKGIEKQLSKNDEVVFLQSDSIKQFYKENPEPVWSDLKFRNSLLEVLKNADLEGLSYSEYHGQEIDSLTAHIRELDNQERSKLDLLLTDAYFQYTAELLNGKVDPR